jgi:hypothetical protein
MFLFGIIRSSSSRSRRLPYFSTYQGVIATSLKRAFHSMFIFAPFS